MIDRFISNNLNILTWFFTCFEFWYYWRRLQLHGSKTECQRLCLILYKYHLQYLFSQSQKSSYCQLKGDQMRKSPVYCNGNCTISAFWSYWKCFCKLSASFRRRGEWFLSIVKRSLRKYGLYFTEGGRFWF